MTIILHKPIAPLKGNLHLFGSKSISNRLLIIKVLSHLKFELKNISESDDTKHLQKALDLIAIQNTEIKTIDVEHAGTDMRFLTALLSITKGEYILTGSEQIQQRPIEPLVKALQQLGADITYEKKIGYPPITINGKDLIGGKINLPANVSSQFISALLLIAPYLKNGLELDLIGEVVSVPYIDMTIDTMSTFGAKVLWNNNNITVKPITYQFNQQHFNIESDWSSASYFYSMVALSPIGTSLTLSKLQAQSLQADALCANIYKHFGVDTVFNNETIQIIKTQTHSLNVLKLDCTHSPDIAQTVACTCLGLNSSFELTGLQTLIIKETNRIEALQKEFLKFHKTLITTSNSISFNANQKNETVVNPIIIDTYNDHRMAMAFAPLCLIYDELHINHSEVVSKSYPNFWKDLKNIGIPIEEIENSH